MAASQGGEKQYVCDVCSILLPESEVGYYAPIDMHRAVRNGFLPRGEYWESMVSRHGIPREMFENHWRNRVLSDYTRWGLCPDCVKVIQHILSAKPGQISSSVRTSVSDLANQDYKHTYPCPWCGKPVGKEHMVCRSCGCDPRNPDRMKHTGGQQERSKLLNISISAVRDSIDQKTVNASETSIDLARSPCRSLLGLWPRLVERLTGRKKTAGKEHRKEADKIGASTGEVRALPSNEPPNSFHAPNSVSSDIGSESERREPLLRKQFAPISEGTQMRLESLYETAEPQSDSKDIRDRKIGKEISENDIQFLREAFLHAPILTDKRIEDWIYSLKQEPFEGTLDQIVHKLIPALRRDVAHDKFIEGALRWDQSSRDFFEVSCFYEANNGPGGLFISHTIGRRSQDVYCLWYTKRDLDKYLANPLQYQIDNEKKSEIVNDRAAKEPINHTTLIELARAAENADLSRVRELVESGFDPFYKDESMAHSAFEAASRKGHTEIVVFLLRQGPSIDARSNALREACYSGHKRIVELLLEAGVNLEHKSYDSSPFRYGVLMSHLDISQTLLKAGADINTRDERGRSPLIQVAINQRHDDLLHLVQFLLDNGADINIKDSFKGANALMWAAYKDSAETIKLLLDAGARIDDQDDLGRTALFWAAEDLNIKIVELLLQRGADSRVKDNNGRDATDCVSALNYREGTPGFEEKQKLLAMLSEVIEQKGTQDRTEYGKDRKSCNKAALSLSGIGVLFDIDLLQKLRPSGGYGTTAK